VYFGDNKEHSKVEIVYMGVVLSKKPQKLFWEKLMKVFLEYGWLTLVKRSVSGNDIDDVFKLTKKGDSLLRDESIQRGGDVSYYKGFDRSLGSFNKLVKPISGIKA